MTNKQIVFLEDLGLKPYKEVWDYQEKLLQHNVAIKSRVINKESEVTSSPCSMHESVYHLPETDHHLLLVQHPPVYTIGKTGHTENMLLSDEEMEARGIENFRINRGGDITFHGPGQLVGYPILDLEKFFTDIGKYLRYLEEVIIKTIGEFGIKGERSKGETGVWLDADRKGYERKICAMGVRCSRWITMHGWALNVNTDLSYFSNIIPCGIKDKQVTSIQKELGEEMDFDIVKKVLVKKFEEVFEVEMVER